jgi:TonB family protein
MTIYLWSLAAYAVQLAVIVAAALALIALLRIRLPRHTLGFWQVVMAIAVLIPLAQSRGGDATVFRFIAQSLSSASTATVQGTLIAAGINYGAVVLVILAAGMFGRFAWLAMGLVRLRAIVARTERHETLARSHHDLFESLGVAADVRLSDDLEGPATVGVRRPVILLPRAVAAMSRAVQRAIICHELVHVKRRDWLFTLVEEAWCAVFWFHPLARILAARLSIAREMVVDEWTILITRDRRAYAEALLAFSNPQPHIVGATPFIGRRALSQRIALIASEAVMSPRRALWSIAVALGVLIGTTVAIIERVPMFATLHAQSPVYEPGRGVTLPVVLHEVKPEYTKAAMQQQIQGSVVMLCVVGESGDITDAEVTRSLDAEFGLDQAAIDAVRQWKFKPGRKGDTPVAVRVTIEMTFTLKK